MPIRVLHIIGSLRAGGAQVSLKYLVENAEPKHIETFVYPLRPKYADIPIKGDVIKIPYLNYDPRKFLAILRICRKHNIDIIHAHLNKSILGSLLTTFFCKVKVIVHERGPVFRKGPQYSFYRLMLRFLHHRAAAIIANSHATAAQLVKKAKIDPKQITVIPNAVDFEKFNPQKTERSRTRKMLKANPDDIVLGFVGRLNYVKGVDILIKAMPLLLKKSPQYLLALVGQGPQEPYLHKLVNQFDISDRVRFLGFNDNVPEIMDAFDIAVVPSRQEPFGIVAVEIMRKKIPMVCSDADGLAELVEDNVNALVPKKNMPGNVCEKIETLANDKMLQQKLADNAYSFSEKFSIKNCVDAVQKIYFEVTNSNRG